MPFSNFVKKWIFVVIPALIVLSAAAVIGLGFLRVSPDIPQPPQTVVLATVAKGRAVSALKAIGQATAARSVEVRARVSGFLVAKPFEEGDLVKAGQLLFKIEPEQYQAALSAAEADESSAKAQLERAGLDFRRISDLYAKRSSTKSDFDNAQADLNVAQAGWQSASARLEQARLNLRYTEVTAPFDGRVSDSPYSVGSYLTPESGALATVVQTDPVEVVFGLSDRFMNGARLELERGGLPGGTLANTKFRLVVGDGLSYEREGRLVYISPTVDDRTDTVRLKVAFDNPEGRLAPGQSVTVVLEPIEPRTTLLIPKGAVLSSQAGNFVYTPVETPARTDPATGAQMAPGLAAQAKPVVLGEEYVDGFEVVEGLAEGEQIILQGLMSQGSMLRPGAPIVVASPEGAGDSEASTAGAGPAEGAAGEVN
ncbi:MAG: efflux RND transporter periplasmic adaptor subunit [Deltaproteobacteria bacterium]|jgi:membrane fusion protein (multidrug efflux system)|nr:efflux RND transporter periplasmic adaptor subunit [Deltaproteobacteria bacterium]